MYDKAINVAVRGGYIQDAALGSERYALYLLATGDGASSSNVDLDAKHYMDQAIAYYSEWGALKKVELLDYL